MKTILISDVGGKQETIIPYALNFTKQYDNSINLIHVVDPGKHHAVCSSYADSQSFEVGRKLTHTEILEREKHQASLSLDKLLSKEASKLNYPLRVNIIVEENTLENRLHSEIGMDEPTLIIATSELEGTIVHDLDEFFETTGRFNIMSLFVPPGYNFSLPQKAIIKFDFNNADNDGIFKLFDCLKPFNPLITVADVVEMKNHVEMVIKSEVWKQFANNYMKSSLHLSTNILSGKNLIETLLNFIRRNNYDLVAFPEKMKDSSGINILSREQSKQLIKHLDIPVMLY